MKSLNVSFRSIDEDATAIKCSFSHRATGNERVDSDACNGVMGQSVYYMLEHLTPRKHLWIAYFLVCWLDEVNGGDAPSAAEKKLLKAADNVIEAWKKHDEQMDQLRSRRRDATLD